VSCEGLDKRWIGTVLDEENLVGLKQLAKKHRFNVDGEGGEYETLVIAGPHFEGELQLEGDVHWDGVRGTFKIQNVQTIA
jgi:diphthamide synthase (EF-2-diphthine--ammonia ligase)